MAGKKKGTLARIVDAVDSAVQAAGLTTDPASEETEHEPKAVRKARQKASIERAEQAHESAVVARRASRPIVRRVRSPASRNSAAV